MPFSRLLPKHSPGEARSPKLERSLMRLTDPGVGAPRHVAQRGIRARLDAAPFGALRRYLGMESCGEGEVRNKLPHSAPGRRDRREPPVGRVSVLAHYRPMRRSALRLGNVLRSHGRAGRVLRRADPVLRTYRRLHLLSARPEKQTPLRQGLTNAPGQQRKGMGGLPRGSV